jgi:hypothetical protein
MAFVKTEPDSNGYKKIFIEYGSERCAHIMWKYVPRTDTIGLAHVSCSCPRLKGRCLKILLSEMIYSPDYTDNTKVELMVEPDELDETINSKLATQKLIAHYSKYGFSVDSKLDSLMTSTVGEISRIVDVDVVAKGKRTKSRKSKRKKDQKRKSRKERKDELER